MKKIIILALSVLLLLSAALPAFAAQIDPDCLGSITATMVHDGEPISGGSLTLYKVADLDLTTESGFRYTEEYADSDVELDSFGYSTAVDLATYTYLNDIQGEEKTIGADGVVKFDDLEPGLYLMIQWDAAEGFYHLAPFLVSVPNNEGGEYVYDVTCVPKQDPIPKPTLPEFPTCPSEPTWPTWPSWPTCPTEPESPTTEPEPPTTEPEPPTTEPEPPVTQPTEPEQPTTEPSEPSEEPTTQPTEPKPTEPQLPQTGQTQWPIPVLAVCGCLCIVLGLILMTADRKKPYDA